MSMDVSRLGIVVESTGIKEAATALQGRNGKGGLAGAAEKAETNVNKLTASLGKLLSVNTSATTAAWASAMGQLGSSITQVGQQLNGIVNQLNAVTAGMQQVTGATQRATKANEEHARGSHVVMNTLKALTTVATVYSAINFAKNIIEAADAYQQLDARLKNVTGSQHNANLAMRDLYEISQKVRTPMKDTSTIMVRLFDSMGGMGKKGEDVVEVTEAIATGMKLWGSTGAETASAMLQLSQAFNKGKLDGAEFNSVAENGKPLLKAIAKEMGVTTDALFTLRSQGKITGEVMVKAFQNMLPTWRKQMEEMPVTFEDAIQRIKNRWDYAIGLMGRDTGFNRELSASLKVIEDMIPVIARSLADAFVEVLKWVKENKQEIGEVLKSLKLVVSTVWLSVESFIQLNAEVFNTGKSSEFLKLVLKGIALLIAGIADGLSVVYATALGLAGVFTHVSAILTGFVTGPLFLLLKGFQKFAEFTAWLSGDESEIALAKGFQEASDSVAAFQTQVNETAISFYDKSEAIWSKMASGASVTKKVLEAASDTGSKAVKTTISDIRKLDAAYDSLGEGHKSKEMDEKAAKAAAAERKRFDDAMVQAVSMRKEQEELNKRLEEYGLAYEKLGPAQKKVIELSEQQARLEKDHASAASIAHNLALLKVYEEAAALEKKNEHLKEGLQLQQKILEAQGATVKSVQGEADKAEAKLAQYGEPKGVDQLGEIERVKQRIAELDATSDQSRTANLEVMIAMLNQELEARNRIYEAESALGRLEVEDQFTKLMDPKKAEKFGDALANGFGKTGKAIGEMIKGMQSFETRMSKVGKAWELVNKQTDPTKKAKMSAQAAELEQEAWVSTYADMAGAAKGFFEEGSRGYKAMQAVEQGFRAWQMAMQLKSFLQEIGLINAVTTAKVVGNEVSAASAVSASTTEVAASMAAGSASAVAGVANQAQGDPYSAFFRMAAMAAIMAALGFAVGGIGGGSGKSVSAQRQARQGTGTVLGDPDAKSESISKSLEYLTENSDIALRYSSGMLRSLQNIEASLTGAVNGIIRKGDVVTGRGFSNFSDVGLRGPLEEGFKLLMSGGLSVLTGGLSSIGRMLGFGSSKKLLDSGITSDSQTVGDILQNGFNGKSYQDIQKSSSFLGIKYSSSRSRDTDDLDPAINDEFTMVIDNMVSTLTDAATVLGFSASEVEARLKAANISLGDISLKDLSAEEIQKELEAVFGEFGDKLADVAFDGAVDAFQQAGEGLLETAVRVASGVEQADYELEKLGLTAIDFRDIINVNGDVAAEIVRQSIALTEQGTGVGEIIEQMTGSASDIASVYKDLVDVRDSLSMLGIADDVTRELIRAAGGLDAMKDALESYTDNFFSDAEKNAMHAESLNKEFDKLGLTMPTTKEGFRALVDELSSSGASGQELAMKLLLLSDSFADLMDNTTVAIDQARNDLIDAYDRESQALTDTKERFEEFAKSLGDFKDSLLLGDLSTSNPLEKYTMQKARYEDVATRAAAGDESAMAEFESVAQAFLEASREVYASSDQYTMDFQRVLNETTALQADATGKASIAQQQLDALNAQVEGLIEVNESVLTVAEAIDALLMVMNGGYVISTDADGRQTYMPVVNGSHANGLARVPFDGYIAELHADERVLTAQESRNYSQYGANNTVALVEEIKALRAEVCALKDGQREQTGALIAANYDANERNAQTIVEGQQDVARTSNYTQRAQVTLA